MAPWRWRLPCQPAAGERLKISDNHRYLVYEDGRPFFYLGDTAWELFHKLNREEAVRYLEDRARKQYTVIQAVVLAELDGLHTPNPYGHQPLKNDDPTQPNEEYFRDVDFIVKAANQRGLFIGMLPTWGDKWNQKWGKGPVIFNPQNAEAYGEWLGRRYKEASIIWILGGDRPVENDEQKEIIRAMARGLKKGDGGAHLMTFHPMGGSSSSQYFHEDAWLDFNMRQNGHVAEFTGRYDQTLADYQRTPSQAGAGRGTDLRGPPGFIPGGQAGAFHCGGCAAAPVLGSLHGRLRAYLRPSFRLADVRSSQGRPD